MCPKNGVLKGWPKGTYAHNEGIHNKKGVLKGGQKGHIHTMYKACTCIKGTPHYNAYWSQSNHMKCMHLYQA